ncbi:MAG TPA: YciI family protein [Blastocatellia bacterium]|nr:YciI family protein [Blastocatellia bacterium]
MFKDEPAIAFWMRRHRIGASLTQLIAAAVLCSLLPIASAGGSRSSSQEPKFEMGIFYLCLLVKGPKFNPAETPMNAPWGPGHIKHMVGLIESGRVLVAGPFTDGDRICGALVTTAASADEARSWAEADPGVKAGQFAVEVIQWFAAKNVMKKPDMPPTPVTYYLAFLKRGPKWTGESTPETNALQAAHMAHIKSMAATGKLVIAGPFTNAPPYAGVFVFKVGSLEEAKSMAEADPTVKAGRLVAELHPWSVAKGSLP